jgi:hypothetical protein
MDTGQPVSTSNASPRRAAVISSARLLSARARVAKVFERLAPATDQRSQ